MFLSDLSIKRPVLMTMFLASLLIFGVIGFLKMPLNLMPDIKIPYITINTIYPGASPEQIDNQITKKIEDSVGTVSQIKSISSYSMNSASVIILEFELSKDPDVANREVKGRIDLIKGSLPGGAEDPFVEKLDITASPILSIVMSGNMEAAELKELAETRVKKRLSRVEGVGSVSVAGGRRREIRVEFDNKVIFERAVNLTRVGQILAAANMDMPAGNFQTGGEDFSVRLEGSIDTLSALDNIRIPTSAGPVRLGSIADISDTTADVRERTVLFDNEGKIRSDNIILLDIIKSTSGNSVEVAKQISSELPGLEKDLPKGTRLGILWDDSIFIDATVNDTLGNLLLGIALTALVLLIFLNDLRSTLIVTLAIPLSVIPTFMVMNSLGMSLNLMSLMGLSTSVGVLIMNSVVVLENIFRHKDVGHGRKKAASRGTAEVVVAVIASTGTNIAVFLPIANMNGMAGLFFKDFALTVAFATIFSMLISFTLTPMLASILLPERAGKKKYIGKALDDLFCRLERGYSKVLGTILRNRGRSAVLLVLTCLIFAGAIFKFGSIPMEFQPAMDTGNLSINIELPQGTALEQTARTVRLIEDRVSGFDEVRKAATTIGSSSSTDRGTNLAVMRLFLTDKSQRDPQDVIATRIGARLADIPNAVIKVSANTGGFGGGEVSFYLQGEDKEKLEEYKRGLLGKLKEIPALINIGTSSKEGSPEMVLYPKRYNLDEAGITVQELSFMMRASIEGMVMTSLKEGGEEYDIRITLNDSDVSGFEEIKNLSIPTPRGIFPLSHFADTVLEERTNKIFSANTLTSIQFDAGLKPGIVLSEVTGDIQKAAADLNMDPGYSIKWAGDSEMMNETVAEMLFVFILAIVLTYMLLAAILERFTQPVRILTTVPLSLIGVVAAFLITGKTLNIISMLSIIMLVGMVVNNAILILEYANRKQMEGMSVKESLLASAPVKLKPILMANTATMLGMLPMAVGIGSAGSELRQPMGIVSIGGLLTATFLSLFVIPALENLTASRKKKSGKTAICEGAVN